MSVNFIKATPSEPTIDEMISWLSVATAPVPEGVDERIQQALCRILDKHRNLQQSLREDAERMKADLISNSKVWWDASKIAEIQLEAIRAFVERVEQRLPDYTTGRTADSRLREYRRAVYSELEAMENESK